MSTLIISRLSAARHLLKSIKSASAAPLSNQLIAKRNYVKSLYEDEFDAFGGGGSSPARGDHAPTSSKLVKGDVYRSNNDYGLKRYYKGRVKAVIFDWGGTVVDCGVCAPILTYVDLFKAEGVEITEDEARAPIGISSRDHIISILEKAAVRRRWRRAKGNKDPTMEDVERMVDKFIPQVLSSLQKYSNVIDGVVETVKLLRTDHQLKIGATTGYPASVLSVLLNASASQGFIPDVSVCLSEVPPLKPSPFMVWKCAMRLGVSPIQSLVKVDDSVSGCEEGILAGCWTVGIASTSAYVGLTEQQLTECAAGELQRRLDRAYRKLHASGAHYVIHSIRDLPPVIQDINRRLAMGDKP